VFADVHQAHCLSTAQSLHLLKFEQYGGGSAKTKSSTATIKSNAKAALLKIIVFLNNK
jgi:hypothetical protein